MLFRSDPLVLSFIGVRPALLLGEPGETQAYPTPRSWEIASDVMSAMGGPKEAGDVLPGVVGQGAAVEFAAFVKRALNEKALRAVVDDPMQATLPTDLDGIYMLTSWLAFHAAQEDVSVASAVLLSRLPPEFGVVLARDMVKARPAFMKEAGYGDFLKTHGHLITR